MLFRSMYSPEHRAARVSQDVPVRVRAVFKFDLTVGWPKSQRKQMICVFFIGFFIQTVARVVMINTI